MRDAGAVVGALRAGARANREASCRRGSIDVVEVRAEDAGTPAGTLIATGDLHDSPLHLARVVRAAGMDEADPSGSESRTTRACHLTLHELIHGERLVNGMDYSYRVLVRAAALKAAFPERVHVLLANHEIAQLIGSAVVKDGVRCNEAFDEALGATFGDGADLGAVREAIGGFIRSMALALRITRPGLPDILCSHSLPAPGLMDRFDPGVLERELVDEDFLPRTGSAYLMAWGRGWTPEHFDGLGERWGVGLFVLGHEKAEAGCMVVGPRAVVLNSDHERGVYSRVDLTRAAGAAEVAGACVALSPVE
ncbi:MAG TPA: hypothetical protein PKE29_04980 [Phycisphaerales bacterium]|nr:hypothetical protein [Phycisphaerales bacterium]